MWICGASNKSLGPDKSEWDRSVMDEAYILVPFLEHKIDPQEWHDILSTLDVSAFSKPTQFCDSMVMISSLCTYDLGFIQI